VEANCVLHIVNCFTGCFSLHLLIIVRHLDLIDRLSQGANRMIKIFYRENFIGKFCRENSKRR